MAVSDDQIIKTKELERIADDLEGVRKVQSLYGGMPSENYQILLIANRDQLDEVKKRVDNLIAMRDQFPNEDDERQFFLMVNDANEINRPFGMDVGTKNDVIDAFKSIIPLMDNAKEQEYDAKKLELDNL